jgi:hypothetical protein
MNPVISNILKTKMKFVILFALAFVNAAQCSDIIDYGDNFEIGIKQHPLAFVKYFTTYCPFCKAMKKDFETAATIIKVSNR